ncbi:hypothetical protein [Microbacterium sp.]|uniref:hypothetical protein n=1 Tax=Microbacterium sp. TaxID=51671 RepID=UPI003C755F54
MTDPHPAGNPLSRLTSALRGAGSLALGFSFSTLLLALLSLIMIPVMISASGADVWGQIALGQSVAAFLSVVVGWGWNVDGPARVAHASTAERAMEFRYSVKARLLLLVPTIALALLLGVALNPGDPLPVMIGGTISVVGGLSPLWFFAGIRRPYANLLLETVPRVVLSVIGIVMMLMGASAVIGAGMQAVSMIVSAAIANWWVLRSNPRPASAETERLSRVLWSRRHGLSAGILSMAYAGAPIVIVYLVAPGVQPAFALYDRVARQIGTGLSPIITAIQAWVPTVRKSRQQLSFALVCIVASAVLGLLVLWPMIGPLVHTLGSGTIPVDTLTALLVAASIALAYLDAVVVKAVLPVVGRLSVATVSLALGMVVGLPLVAVGACFGGTAGALGGVNLGLLLRVVLVLSVSFRTIRSANKSFGTS